MSTVALRQPAASRFPWHGRRGQKRAPRKHPIGHNCFARSRNTVSVYAKVRYRILQRFGRCHMCGMSCDGGDSFGSGPLICDRCFPLCNPAVAGQHGGLFSPPSVPRSEGWAAHTSPVVPTKQPSMPFQWRSSSTVTGWLWSRALEQLGFF